LETVLLLDRYLCDHRSVGSESELCRDASAPPLWQWTTPSCFLRGEPQHGFDTARIIWSRVITLIGKILWLAQKLHPQLNGIFTPCTGEFVKEALNDESVRIVRRRPPGPCRDSRFSLGILETAVRNQGWHEVKLIFIFCIAASRRKHAVDLRKL